MVLQFVLTVQLSANLGPANVNRFTAQNVQNYKNQLTAVRSADEKRRGNSAETGRQTDRTE